MDPYTDPKWADRKRLAALGPNKREKPRDAKEERRTSKASVSSNATSPQPAKQPISGRDQAPASLSDLNSEEPETPILSTLRGEMGQPQQYKKYPSSSGLGELRGAPKLAPPPLMGQGWNTSNTATDDLHVNIGTAKYNDAMKQAKYRQRLPHENAIVDESPKTGKDDFNIGKSVTPTPHGAGISPKLLRPTHDGGIVSMPTSRLAGADNNESETSDAGNASATNDLDILDALQGGISGVNGVDIKPVKRRGRIRVVVRKRPVRDGEAGGEDIVEVVPPTVRIAAMKQRVDLSEYTENFTFAFDDSFTEDHNNEHVYASCGRALLDTVFEGGSASCFAYGQTGSGKTHTMIGNENEMGMYILAAKDLFARVHPENHRVFVSLYEIYCNSLFDLLNYRSVVVVREDANKKVNICGLTWHEISNCEDLRRIIERGTVQRRTGSTSANEFSSRSHAIMTITLRDEANPKFCGSLNIVDLAGSERAADTAATDKQTRLEGAEINKSLLALKECIRGLDERKRHIPFRGSKLTEVLRDSFLGNCRTVMVATVSPCTDSVEHTLNTLRYSFRVKGLSIAQVDPSKERNAPRPIPIRSRSLEPPMMAPGPASMVPSAFAANYPLPLLPPLVVDPIRKKKKSREKRAHHHHRRVQDDDIETSEGANEAGPGVEPGRARSVVGRKDMEALEVGLKSEIQELREELKHIHSQKDAHIATLEDRNKNLELQVNRMMRMMQKTKNMQTVEEEDVEEM